MKAVTKLEDAIATIQDGATVMIGGFLGVGSPHRLLQGLASAGRKRLTVITNDTASGNWSMPGRCPD
jgi:acetate CoA/acetoacetate CoA-transferase alpha subunit